MALTVLFTTVPEVLTTEPSSPDTPVRSHETQSSGVGDAAGLGSWAETEASPVVGALLGADVSPEE